MNYFSVQKNKKLQLLFWAGFNIDVRPGKDNIETNLTQEHWQHVLNEKFVSMIQQHIKELILYHDQVDFISIDVGRDLNPLFIKTQ